MIDRESVIRQLTLYVVCANCIEKDWLDHVSVPMLRNALELLKKQDEEIRELHEELIKISNISN